MGLKGGKFFWCLYKCVYVYMYNIHTYSVILNVWNKSSLVKMTSTMWGVGVYLVRINVCENGWKFCESFYDRIFYVQMGSIKTKSRSKKIK